MSTWLSMSAKVKVYFWNQVGVTGSCFRLIQINDDGLRSSAAKLHIFNRSSFGNFKKGKKYVYPSRTVGWQSFIVGFLLVRVLLGRSQLKMEEINVPVSYMGGIDPPFLYYAQRSTRNAHRKNENLKLAAGKMESWWGNRNQQHPC